MRPHLTVPLLLALVLCAGPALAQTAAAANAAVDTVTARPLDGGKMWLFEEPPTDYHAASGRKP